MPTTNADDWLGFEPAEAFLSGHVMFDEPPPNDAGERRELECVFISAGRVKRGDQTDSNILIPASTLINSTSLFDSVSCYVDHPDLFGFGWRQRPQIKNLAGVTFSPYFDTEERAIMGCIRLYDQEPGSPGAFIGALFDQILSDKQAGREIPQIGLSAVLYADSELDEEEGVRVYTNFRYVQSVDFVYQPGAAGYVRAALDASGWNNAGPLDPHGYRVWRIPVFESHPQQVQPHGGDTPQTLGGGNMSEVLSPQDGGSDVQETPPTVEQPALELNQALAKIDTLQATVDRLTTALEYQERQNAVQDMGTPVLRGAMTGLDQVEIAFEALLDGVRPPDGIRPLTGIRELYTLLTGDYWMNGVFNPDEVYLANVDTTSMAGLVANALNKRVVNLYQEYDHWWEPACTVEDFNTLQDVRWITLGGVGELPTVSEGAAYTEMTWDDLTETDSFVKKGGYLGITLEAIDKDDTRRIMAAPRALAQAAWLTLGKSVSSIFTTASGTGPTMSDSVVLFHAASHGNLLTTALSFSAWEAVKVAMMKQTELNSGERLGYLTRPYFLWVPIDLETTALQILASENEPGSADWDINPYAEGEGRMARLQYARSRVIVCPLWTDTDNWAAQADPRLYPSIGLGFRYGRTPEIFSVASPTAGLMFTNDTLPVKVRFFYAVGPIDYRGLHKNNV